MRTKPPYLLSCVGLIVALAGCGTASGEELPVIPTEMSAMPTLQPETPRGLLPASGVLASTAIPTRAGRAGAVELFDFFIRERAAILSGAPADQLARVSASACTTCQSLIALDKTINADDTRVSYPTNLGASAHAEGNDYHVRGTIKTGPGLVTFADGSDMRLHAGLADVQLRAYYHDGGWQITEVRIQSLRARERTPTGNDRLQ
ncbi:MAG: hypothetical protein Q4Q03_05820 [Bowdeniella nasicola]|nr:hypothetical protein [Bowdeniella nasicola]